MSAADLFKDVHDVDFRLKGTVLVIGRGIYDVLEIRTDNYSIRTDDTILSLADYRGEILTVPLGRLPLSAMTYCPRGYYDGIWYCRGPARHRYQGLTAMSLWGVFDNGKVSSDGINNFRRLLGRLVHQPMTRRIGKMPIGILTRDILIRSDGAVLSQGLIVGTYVGNNQVRPLYEPDLITIDRISSAGLRII